MSTQNIKPMWHADELATFLGITPESVRVLLRAGRIPGARRLGKLWLIPAASIEALANGGSP